MLLELQRDSQTSVIRHPTIKAVIDQCIGDVDSSSEDLVQVSTQSMGDGVWIHCMGETEEVQLSVHVRDVVVEVTTHHNNRVHILFDDILDDISHSVCSILLELLLTRFKVAVEYLNLVPTCRHPRPAEVCSQCLHQCQSHFVGCCCPDSSISLQHRLMRPVVVEIHWYRQLGLIQTHQLEVLSVNEITDHLLLLFSIEASDVEAHHGNFLQLLQYFVVSSLLVVSSVRCFVGWCCSSVRILHPPTILLCCCCSSVRTPISSSVLLWFCCSSVRTPLFPSILLWWYPHVSILLLFPHSRRPIVSLVLSLVRRIRWSSILRRVGTDLSLLLFWGLEEFDFLLHLAHLKNRGFLGFGKLFNATH
jgi:hypothetical protein